MGATHFDRSAIDHMREMSKTLKRDVVTQVVQTFLGEAPQLLNRLVEAVRSRNLKSVRDCSHYLRSGALGVGAVSLADACLELERHVEDASLERQAQLVTDIRKELIASLSDIKSEMARPH